ncbi:hypothetical protein Glove_330g49 [Diversispora epigaea]|uniref:Uncharacterized protein n=1 Tax=Diversispora epigaea TaxID=1348612 RepID=A0A397HJW3_9GLOM|nr:hypothetical protein Glove_330g49 [Diversispora epigaea]
MKDDTKITRPLILVTSVFRATSIDNNFCNSASADRREKGKQGKRPAVMFMEKHREKLYELMFVECSRLICTEMNNGT